MAKVKAEVAGVVLTLLGYDGTDFYNVLVDVNGRLQVDVIGSGLPAGAATAANQVLLLAELGEKLETADLDLDGDGKLAILNYGYTGAVWFPILIDALGHLQVDAVTCALPPGAASEVTLALVATDAKLELCRLLLVSIEDKDFATQVTLAALLTELALKANLTQTQPVSAVTLPLPTGAAEESTLATINTSIAGVLAPEDLNIEGGSKDLQVDVKTSGLPTGAATSAKQTTLQTELDKMTDIRYQGDHILEQSGTVSCVTGVETTLIDYTVPANKVVYIYGWGVGFFHIGAYGLGSIGVGASSSYQSYTNGAPLASVGVCFGKAVATEHIVVRGRQESGGNVYVNGWFLGILEDA